MKNRKGGPVGSTQSAEGSVGRALVLGPGENTAASKVLSIPCKNARKSRYDMNAIILFFLRRKESNKDARKRRKQKREEIKRIKEQL